MNAAWQKAQQAVGMVLPPAVREKHRDKLRVLGEILFEIVLVVVFLKAYNSVRNQFGSQSCTPEYALGHAKQIIQLEKWTGLFWEQEIQVR